MSDVFSFAEWTDMFGPSLRSITTLFWFLKIRVHS